MLKINRNFGELCNGFVLTVKNLFDIITLYDCVNFYLYADYAT